jgi:AcrR family transcriptional regulator
MNNTRELLIDAMKALMWERGYDATSPNMILARSGAGKGSFYHHFKGKKELAIAAMQSREVELKLEIDSIFSSNLGWVEKFEQYLLKPRNGLMGCRLGRIAQDPSLADDSELKEPIARYFKHLEQVMSNELRQAKSNGFIPLNLDENDLAVTMISLIQGGFVLSQGVADKNKVSHAAKGIISLLKAIAL